MQNMLNVLCAGQLNVLNLPPGALTKQKFRRHTCQTTTCKPINMTATAVQEAAATTIQAKTRALAARKIATARWQEQQLQRFNLLALFVQKEHAPRTTRSITSTKKQSRVSLAAASTIQTWSRSILMRKHSQEKEHSHRVQAVKGTTNALLNKNDKKLSSLSSGRDPLELLRKLLLVTACVALLSFQIQQQQDAPRMTATRVMSNTTCNAIRAAVIPLRNNATAVLAKGTTTILPKIIGNNETVNNQSKLAVLEKKALMKLAPLKAVPTPRNIENKENKSTALTHLVSRNYTIITNNTYVSNAAFVLVPKVESTKILPDGVGNAATPVATRAAVPKAVTTTKEKSTPNEIHSSFCNKSAQLSPETFANVQSSLAKSARKQALESYDAFLECAQNLKEYTGLLKCMQKD
jgi:hypothetical protein